MASVNKTVTLQLSQFTTNDKPSWLTDYNDDMEKIDTFAAGVDGDVSQAISDAASAKNTAQTASTAAQQAQTAATQAQNTATAAQTAATQAQTAATQAQSAASSAQASTNAIINGWKKGAFTKGSGVSSAASFQVYYKYNKQLGIMSIYGAISFTGSTGSLANNAVIASGLPLEAVGDKDTTIYAFLNILYHKSPDFIGMPGTAIIDTNGNIKTTASSTYPSNINEITFTATIIMSGNGNGWPAAN